MKNMKRKIATVMAALTLVSAAGVTAAVAESTPTEQNEVIVGMANPWHEVESLEALNRAAGVELTLPKRDGITDIAYRMMETEGQHLAEITFVMNGVKCTLRASYDATEDISGVYVNEGNTAFRADEVDSIFMDETRKMAHWLAGGTQYVLIVEDEESMDAEEFTALVDELKGKEAVLNDWAALPADDETESGIAYDYTAYLEPYYDILDDLKNPQLAAECENNEDFYDQMFAVGSGKYGYVLKDIDGDGNLELIVATDTEKDPYYGKMVLLMVTNDGKETKLVFKSSERSRYYYAGDNKFAYVGSNSASDSIETTYAFENGKLVDLNRVTSEGDYVQMPLEEIKLEDDAVSEIDIQLDEVGVSYDFNNGALNIQGKLHANDEVASLSAMIFFGEVKEEKMTTDWDGQQFKCVFQTPELGGITTEVNVDLEGMKPETLNALIDQVMNTVVYQVLDFIN